MENQSTIENKVICRKCGGSHFTIKCGKEKQDVSYEKKSNTRLQKNKTFCNEDRVFQHRPYFKTTFRVKLSDLPVDMSEEEMMELTCDWGHIVKIRIINYSEISVAYIDFGYEDEAEYFVKALDKTPFEFLVISAQRVEIIN
jgi:hypothetical protein